MAEIEAMARKDNEADDLIFQHGNAATASAALVKQELTLEPTDWRAQPTS